MIIFHNITNIHYFFLCKSILCFRAMIFFSNPYFLTIFHYIINTNLFFSANPYFIPEPFFFKPILCEKRFFSCKSRLWCNQQWKIIVSNEIEVMKYNSLKMRFTYHCKYHWKNTHSKNKHYYYLMLTSDNFNQYHLCQDQFY